MGNNKMLPIEKLAKEVEALTDERNKLLKFKAYTHQRLDEMGVPENPDPEGVEASGCRVGARFDWLAAYGPKPVVETTKTGLYRVHWKWTYGGGDSLAAVYHDPDGEKMLAATHWRSPVLLKSMLYAIERLEPIAVDEKSA